MEHIHEARWCMHEDDEALTLQIELGNDRTVTLVCWKNGDPPSVSVWTGSGYRSFIPTEIDPGETLDSFRPWIKEAIFPRARTARSPAPR